MISRLGEEESSLFGRESRDDLLYGQIDSAVGGPVERAAAHDAQITS